METLPRGARTMSTPPRFSSTSSAPAVTLSGPGNDGQRFAYVQSIIHTAIGREEFSRGMTAF